MGTMPLVIFAHRTVTHTYYVQMKSTRTTLLYFRLMYNGILQNALIFNRFHIGQAFVSFNSIVCLHSHLVSMECVGIFSIDGACMVLCVHKTLYNWGFSFFFLLCLRVSEPTFVFVCLCIVHRHMWTVNLIWSEISFIVKCGTANWEQRFWSLFTKFKW